MGLAALFMIPAFAWICVSASGSEDLSRSPAEVSLWTLESAEQILWKSPWVREGRFRFFNSKRRIRQITYYVRLQSALPVRLAMAKAYLSQPEANVIDVGGTDPEELEELSKQFRLPDEVVFAVIISPQFIHRRLNGYSFETLAESSYLQLGDKKIRLKEFVPPEKTTFGEAWFRFPRPELDLGSGKIRFVTSLEVPYRISVDSKFDPSELEFMGRLEY